MAAVPALGRCAPARLARPAARLRPLRGRQVAAASRPALRLFSQTPLKKNVSRSESKGYMNGFAALDFLPAKL